MNSKTSLSIISILVFGAGILATAPALAATTGVETGQRFGRGQLQQRQNGVSGTITAINGTNLMVSGRQGFGNAGTAITYTVDTSAAKVFKDNVASSLSTLAVGNSLRIEGTISGTNIAATSIRFNSNGGPQGMRTNGKGERFGSSTIPAITGNGQPVVAGSVTAISGATITVATRSGIQYTVDTASAKIVKGQATISLANVMVGDTVVVQGLTSGTSITASSVIDQNKPVVASIGAGTEVKNGNHFGFFGQMGGFFKKLFGF